MIVTIMPAVAIVATVVVGVALGLAIDAVDGVGQPPDFPAAGAAILRAPCDGAHRSQVALQGHSPATADGPAARQLIDPRGQSVEVRRGKAEVDTVAMAVPVG